MNQVQIITVAALVIFAALMTLIGLISIRKTRTIDGFLLGNRKIGPWVSAFAYGTSYFSAVIFVGYAGKHGWDIGLGSIWIGVGNAVLGCLLAWLLLAKRTRHMTRTLSAKTMPEFFEARYQSKGMKIFSALVIFVFLVPYSACVYKGLGSMFNAIFPGASVNLCMLLVAALTAVYLVLGGYVATAYTDFIQGIVMIGGIFCMVIAIVNTDAVGGFGQVFQRLAAIPDNGDGITGAQLVNGFGGSAFSFLCVNILLTSFGPWGLPQMVTKYYAVKSDAAIKQATVISTLFCAIIGCGAYFTGSLSRLVLGNEFPEGGSDAVIPTMLLKALGGNTGLIIILAVVMVLLFSASMSTLASVVLTSASAISVDLLPALNKNVKPKTQMWITRALCLLFVALSYLFATMNISIIVNIMSFSWGAVAGAFLGAYIWGIFWKRTTKAGAFGGMIVGLLAIGIPTLVLSLTQGFKTAVSLAPQMGIAAMLVSFLAVPVISLFTKPFAKEHIDYVFSDKTDEQ